MARTEKSRKLKPMRTLSLVRVEALTAQGPLYLVVMVDSDGPDDGKDHSGTRSEWDRLHIEEWQPPEAVMQHVVAVIRGGEAQPEKLFTHVRSHEADPTFNDFDIMDTGDWLKIFPEAAK